MERQSRGAILAMRESCENGWSAPIGWSKLIVSAFVGLRSIGTKLSGAGGFSISASISALWSVTDNTQWNRIMSAAGGLAGSLSGSVLR